MKRFLLWITLSGWVSFTSAGWVVGVDSLSAYSGQSRFTVTLESNDLSIQDESSYIDTDIQHGLSIYGEYRWQVFHVRLTHREWSEFRKNDYLNVTNLSVGVHRNYESWHWDWSLGTGKVQHGSYNLDNADIYSVYNYLIDESSPALITELNVGYTILPNWVLNLGYMAMRWSSTFSGEYNKVHLSGESYSIMHGVHFGVRYHF